MEIVKFKNIHLFKRLFMPARKSCVASLAETSQGLYFPSTKFKNSDLIQNIHAERLFPIFLVDSLCLNFEDKFPDSSLKMKLRFKK